jgi:pectin methylesterase-like acyl-CoA thioesterase
MAEEGLGRVFNVALIASGAGLSLKNGQGVTFAVSGADSGVVLTSSATFAGTYATPGNIITRKQTNTSTNGTAAWVEATQAASNTVVCAAGSTTFYVDANDLPAGNAYVKATAGSTGLITAFFHDLLVQRDPANMVALGV